MQAGPDFMRCRCVQPWRTWKAVSRSGLLQPCYPERLARNSKPTNASMNMVSGYTLAYLFPEVLIWEDMV